MSYLHIVICLVVSEKWDLPRNMSSAPPVQCGQKPAKKDKNQHIQVVVRCRSDSCLIW